MSDFREDMLTVILDCGYASPYDQLSSEMKKRRLPRILMMPTLLLLARIRPGLNLRTKLSAPLSRTRVPALFLHCEGDKVVPPAQLEENYAACASEKERILVPGGSHTTAFLAGGDEVKRRILAFTERYFKKGNPV